MADVDQAAGVDFIARLGSAMLGADYPVTIVKRTLTLVSDRYGIECPVLVLPNFVQAGEGELIRVVNRDKPLRYDQTFPLGELVQRAEQGQVTPAQGWAELDRIHALPARFPSWVAVLGCAVQSAAYALILQPTVVALVAATGFGLLVGVLVRVTGSNPGLRQLLPVVSAFLVTYIAFSLGRLLHMGHGSFRVLIPPLTFFLPGVAITLAVVEASTGHMISGAARLTSGLLRLAQLALGIILNLGPPRGFWPWLVLVLFITYGAQVATAAVFGGYVSGFGGGLVLMLCALTLSRLPMTPRRRWCWRPDSGCWRRARWA